MRNPTALNDLLLGQNTLDDEALRRAFHPEATVDDERMIYTGLSEILAWVHGTTTRYRMSVNALNYSGTDTEGILNVLTTGDFPGSPLTMHYHTKMSDGRIRSLRITG